MSQPQLDLYFLGKAAAIPNAIKGASIPPDRYTDSLTGTAVDLNNGGGKAYFVVSYEVLDSLPSYALQVQVSSNGSSWNDSDADPVTVTDGPSVVLIAFTRSARYARLSLNVVDGPGDIRLGDACLCPI